MPTIFTAGGASDSLALASGNDGLLTLQTGPSGAKVNALALDASGNAALLGTLTQAGIATPRMQLMTAQNTTSGTFVDFTSIPAWVKRVTVMLNGVSSNATGHLLVQLADTGTVRTSGYDSVVGVMAGGGNTVVSSTAGFIIYNSTVEYTNTTTLTLTLMTGNTWMGTVAGKTTFSGPTNSVTGGGGAVTLSGVLDRIRLTSVSGTAVFDLGSANLLLEG